MSFFSKIIYRYIHLDNIFSVVSNFRLRFHVLYLLAFSLCVSPYVVSGQFKTNISTKKLVVHLFFSFECPLCRKYIPIIEEIQKQYNGLIEFDVIVPEKLCYQVDDKNNRKLLGRSFTVVKDAHSQMKKQYNAKATPEVILTDRKNNIIYRGKIDDRAVDIGKWKNFSGHNYLRDAIEETMQGKEVLIKSTLPRGCFI